MKSGQVLLLLVLFGVLVSACHEVGTSDPVYQGKHLSKWMEELNRPEVEETAAAVWVARRQKWTNVVMAVGTKGLPLYLRSLTKPGYPSAKDDAGFAIEILGPKAESAIPALAPLLYDDKTVHSAAYCLRAIGPASIPVLTEAIAHATNQGRYVAFSILGEFGPKAKASVPELLNAINTDLISSDAGLKALVEIEPDPKLLLPLCAKHISDDPNSGGAAFALGRLGKPGTPLLLQCLTNEPRNIRCFATAALSPGFYTNSWQRPPGSPGYMGLVCLYNMQVLRAAVSSYSKGDFRVVAETASHYTNDLDPDIRSAANKAYIYLKPFAETNVSEMKRIDESENPSLTTPQLGE